MCQQDHSYFLVYKNSSNLFWNGNDLHRMPGFSLLVKRTNSFKSFHFKERILGKSIGLVFIRLLLFVEVDKTEDDKQRIDEMMDDLVALVNKKDRLSQKLISHEAE